MADDANPRAVVGNNNPPADPFTAISTHVDDLLIEARNWADGAAIESQDQADVVARLIDDFRAAQTAADAARKEEARPHDEAKAAVQAKYAPMLAETKALTGSIPRALEALKATLTPWLRAQEAARLEAQRRAQADAAAKAAEATEALRAADPANLEAREEAEAQVSAAKDAQLEADRIGRDRSHAKGDGRAIGLRRHYVAVLSDRKAALQHYMVDRPDALVAWLQQQADGDVRNGKRQVPGFDVIEQARV